MDITVTLTADEVRLVRDALMTRFNGLNLPGGVTDWPAVARTAVTAEQNATFALWNRITKLATPTP